MATFRLFLGSISTAVVAVVPDSGVPGKRKKYKSVRFSDLDAREKLLAMAVKPFSPLEQVAYEIAISDDEDEEDDKLLLLACLRILH